MHASPLSESQRRYYAGLILLKRVDLSADDRSLAIPVLLPAAESAIEGLLEELHLRGLIEIDRKRQIYTLTRRGADEVGALIAEIEGIIDEFDGVPVPKMVRTLRRRNLDPFRARFLWGWYDGELDDPIAYQRRRGFAEVEESWASFILGDELYEDLARDLEE
ncbi:MAG: hypothetical protein R3B09_25510 [Nannocystaceae bacterium]